MRYVGQSHEINVKIPFSVIDKKNNEKFKKYFEKEYLRQFSKISSNMSIEVLNWRIITSSIIRL